MSEDYLRQMQAVGQWKIHEELIAVPAKQYWKEREQYNELVAKYSKLTEKYSDLVDKYCERLSIKDDL